ncbi:MAG: PA2778 family cysteine peptidase [Proteobacteria bacterium]|nr:PA2778 family cysteine peptidase [Pseudomonadota bacterium]
MLARWQQRCFAVGMLAFVSGCASDIRNMLSDLEQQRGDVELIQTPFYPQVTDQCGPSALATILNSSGVAVTPEALKSRIYIPGRQGSLQIELLAATRGYGRIPYLIDTHISALLGEVRGGRPVLVLQNLGSRPAPTWHYAVVVGYLADERRFILRSGDQERHVISASRFLRTWQRAGYWGVLVLQPGEMPASPDAGKYVRSVAAVEAIGDIESAVAGYHAATERWPEHSLAWLGMGNAYYAQGNLVSAESAYKRLLSMDSDHLIALNNLSQVQLERGCLEDATATLDAALSAVKPDTTIYRTILETRREIEARNPSAACL